jgi:hypothetical protein
VMTVDECIATIADVLVGCLVQLDDLGMWRAGSHLAQAIAALPVQTAISSLDIQDESMLSILMK